MAAVAANMTNEIQNNPQIILSEVKKFVNSSSFKHEKSISRHEELSKSALFLLQTLPSARYAVLEYLCEVFDDAVNVHMIQLRRGSNLQDKNDPESEDTDKILHEISGVLLGFIKSNPESWSPIISAWAIELLGQISCRYSECQGAPHASSLNELLQLWMTCKSTKILIEIATECFASMIGGAPDICVSTLLEASVKYSPYFDWVVAHIGSCFPTTIITRVLMCGLKDFCHNEPADNEGRSQKMPKIASVVGILGHLAGQHNHDIKVALMNLFEGSLNSNGDIKQLSAVPFLLRLCSMSNMLLKVVTNQLVQILTPETLNKLAILLNDKKCPALQDKESLIDLTVHLLMRTDMAALDVIQLILDIAMPLPGDVRSSKINERVKSTCALILDRVMTKLYFSVQNTRSDNELPLLSALGDKVTILCKLTLESNGLRSNWLTKLLACLAFHCGENCSSEILSYIIVHASTRDMLNVFTRLQLEMESKLPDILHATINKTFETMDKMKESGLLLRMLMNLLSLVRSENGNVKPSRSNIARILRKNLEAISHQLRNSDSSIALITIQILNIIKLPLSMNMELILKLSGATVDYFFRSLRNKVERHRYRGCQLCVQYMKLISQHIPGMNIILRFLIEGIFVHENAILFGSKSVSTYMITQAKDEVCLLTENIKQSDSMPLPQTHPSVYHAGVIGQGLRQRFKKSTISREQQQFNRQAFVEAVLAAGCKEVKNGVHDDENEHEMMIDITPPSQLCLTNAAAHVVALGLVNGTLPDGLYNDIVWPEEDFMRQTVERDLQVKKKFDNNPVLWDLLELVSSSTGGLIVCSPILRSLMATFIQFWSSCRESSTKNVPLQLEKTCVVIECMRRGELLPAPLNHTSEMLCIVTPHQTYLLLLNIWRYLKENPVIFDVQLGRKEVLHCESQYLAVIKAVMHGSIEKFGPLHTRFFPDLG